MVFYESIDCVSSRGSMKIYRILACANSSCRSRNLDADRHLYNYKGLLCLLSEGRHLRHFICGGCLHFNFTSSLGSSCSFSCLFLFTMQWMHMPFQPWVHLLVRKLIYNDGLYRWMWGQVKVLIKVRDKIEMDVILRRGQRKECERKKMRWEGREGDGLILLISDQTTHIILFDCLPKQTITGQSSIESKLFYTINYTYPGYNNKLKMQQKVTINKLITSWSSLPTLNRSILLIGPSHTGRTTYAELIKKHQFKNPSPNLIFDAGKGNYNLEGVISSKSIKIHTIYPAVYEKSKEREELKVVDVPATILPPQMKKWTVLQQRLTLDFMVAKNTKVGFLFFIEQKNTRANIIPWKKALQNFLDLFKTESFSDDLLSSFGMIITKAPGDTKEEAIVNRLKSIKAALQKQKGANQPLIDKLFKYIIQENHFFIFKKTTDDETQRDAILSNWAQLEKLANYRINRDDFKEIPWGEGEKALGEYMQGVDAALKYLTVTLKRLFELEDFSRDKIRAAKADRPEMLNQKMVISEAVEKKLKVQDQKKLNYLSFILEYVELSKLIVKAQAQDFQDLLQRIIKLNLFLQPEDQNVFQVIFQGLDFQKATDYKQFDLSQHLNSFKTLFSPETKTQVFRKLSLAQTGNDNKQFYQTSLKLIDQNFTEPPNHLSQLKQTFKTKLILLSNPKEALKMYISLLQKQTNQEKLYKNSNEIGKILEKENMIYQAGKVYKAGGNIDSALRCLSKAGEADPKAALDHISLLTDLTLFQEAIRLCYTTSSRLEFASRAPFHSALKKTSEARKKYSSEPFKPYPMQTITRQQISDIQSIAKRAIDLIS